MNFWVNLKTPFSVLAPMEEVTDVAFRELVFELGRPDVFFTEFTSAEGMQSRGRNAVAQRLEFKPNQHPIVAQIWGTSPEAFHKTAQEVAELGFDGVDINMGCPVRKIMKNGACAKLIENPTLAKELIAAAKEGAAGKIPVSVKTRVGFKKIETEEWCGFLLQQDIAALTVHGRLAKDLSLYPANWEEIGKAVQLCNQIAPHTILIGNGDILSLADITEKHAQYGIDGGMIGRGVFKDPFVFNPNRTIQELNPQERFELLLRHATLFTQAWNNKKNFSILKRFFKIYIADFDGAAELRAALMDTSSLEDVINAGKAFGMLS